MDLIKTFIFFFITLGPVKLVMPYANLTTNADPLLRRAIAYRTFWLSTLTVVVLTFIANRLTARWDISQNAVAITGGLVLLLWGLDGTTALRRPVAPSNPPAEPSIGLAAFPLTLPHTITPAGIAAVIYFAMTAPNSSSIAALLALLIGTMVLNLLAMLVAGTIHKSTGGVVVLTVAGNVLLLFQAALAIEILIRTFTKLGVLTN